MLATVDLRPVAKKGLGLKTDDLGWVEAYGGMDPYSSPYIIPNASLHNPFPHSLPSTREDRLLKLFPCCNEGTEALPALARDSNTYEEVHG